jgi:hypothetical protein
MNKVFDLKNLMKSGSELKKQLGKIPLGGILGECYIFIFSAFKKIIF